MRNRDGKSHVHRFIWCACVCVFLCERDRPPVANGYSTVETEFFFSFHFVHIKCVKQWTIIENNEKWSDDRKALISMAYRSNATKTPYQRIHDPYPILNSSKFRVYFLMCCCDTKIANHRIEIRLTVFFFLLLPLRLNRISSKKNCERTNNGKQYSQLIERSEAK